MVVEIRDEVVALSGSLRRNQWRTLESAVNVRLKYHPAGIVVDCSGLVSVTPEGAQTFRDAAGHVAGSSGGRARMVIASVPSEVMRVLRQIPNLGSQLPIAASVEEARASLGLAAPGRPGASSDGAAEASHAVVAGLLGTSADPHAVAAACRLARSSGGGNLATPAIVHLAYLLVVPRHVPLLSALGEEEATARQTLESLEAGVRAARLAVVPRVERTRDAAARLIEVAAEVRAGAIALALPPDASEELNALAEATLGRARSGCDVVILCLPPSSAAAPAAAGGASHPR